MTFLPHSSRGRHAVEEQPIDDERSADGEPATGAPGDDPMPPADGQAPVRPRYAFGYAPDDAGDDDAGNDEVMRDSVVRGDVIHEDEDEDYPPVTVADVPGSADPAATAAVPAPTVATAAMPAPAAPTVEVPATEAGQGIGTTGTPVPAPRAASEYQPAVEEPVAADAGRDESLLADAAGLRARWQRAQSDFVDDPRAAVTDAAALVEQTARAMIDALEQRQRLLREQWQSGQAADPVGDPSDTERLRQTMRRYRALFEQLCGR